MEYVVTGRNLVKGKGVRVVVTHWLFAVVAVERTGKEAFLVVFCLTLKNLMQVCMWATLSILSGSY